MECSGTLHHVQCPWDQIAIGNEVGTMVDGTWVGRVGEAGAIFSGKQGDQKAESWVLERT